MQNSTPRHNGSGNPLPGNPFWHKDLRETSPALRRDLREIRGKSGEVSWEIRRKSAKREVFGKSAGNPQRFSISNIWYYIFRLDLKSLVVTQERLYVCFYKAMSSNSWSITNLFKPLRAIASAGPPLFRPERRRMSNVTHKHAHNAVHSL